MNSVKVADIGEDALSTEHTMNVSGV